MTRTQILPTLAVLLVALAGVAVLAEEADEGEVEVEVAVKEIKLYAENWKWTPNTIRVTLGTRVDVEVVNHDSPHRFDLKAYGLKVPLREGEPTKFSFVADQVGKFKWKCGRPCGNGCPKMTGTLFVDEAASEDGQ